MNAVYQVSQEKNVGSSSGTIINNKIQIDHDPQNSSIGGWMVYIGNESEDIQKQYQANKAGWANDSTIQIQKAL